MFILIKCSRKYIDIPFLKLDYQELSPSRRCTAPTRCSALCTRHNVHDAPIFPSELLHISVYISHLKLLPLLLLVLILAAVSPCGPIHRLHSQTTIQLLMEYFLSINKKKIYIFNKSNFSLNFFKPHLHNLSNSHLVHFYAWTFFLKRSI